jgi:hypothetical protein
MFNEIYVRKYGVGRTDGRSRFFVNSNDIVEDDFNAVCMGQGGNFYFQQRNSVLFHISVSRRKLLNSDEPYERAVTVSSCLGIALPKEISHILNERRFTKK